MSWMKRAQAAPPAAEQQPAAPQLYGNQQNAYPNYQSGGSSNNSQQQYWQAPPQPQPQPQYNQQYGQVYQQPVDYGTNANQYYQQQQQPFTQNYPNQTYNTPQQGYQQSFYQNQGAQQQNYAPNKSSDGWEDNWDWGWGDQSKVQKPQGITPQTAPQAAQPAFNNANVIEESFAATDSWNWATEEKEEVKDSSAVNQGVQPPPGVQNADPSQGSNLEAELNKQGPTPQTGMREVRTLNDTEVVKERLPNLALGKRFHIDNLTPQWSIESQMSQDSSDGPQTQSEGTFRSEMQSRNSDKSNYSQHSLDEPYSQNLDWSRQSIDEPTLADNVPNTNQNESHNELTNSMQEMSIANSENPAPDALAAPEPVLVSTQENVTPTPSSLASNFPASASSSQPPPTSSQVSTTLPPPISASIPPPASFPPPIQSSNPFKHAGAFSHKSTVAKAPSSIPTSSQPFPPPISSSNLTSPAVVNKLSQHNRAPVNFGANLETTPDNSERPDQPQVMPFRPMQVTQQAPENLEVAPKSDRNEYLQTAHLSSGDYGENTDFSRNIPPPGLRRMVVGQQESEYNQGLNMSGDEPPPGLARMVPGQQNEAENSYSPPGDNYLERHIDGQPTESGARPYRQADGQQTGGYPQQRRPVGRARRVPGEPSNDEYPPYAPAPYAASDQRVVTGLDRDYPAQPDAGPSDVREQNVDGSDYTILTSRTNDLATDFTVPPEEQQREVIMEGENLQDLSIISSTELTYSRDQTLDGADTNATDVTIDRKTDVSDSIDHPATSSRRQSLNHVNTSGDDSERDRLFKNSPRRDKHRSSRDRDKEGRYSRGDRKLERDPERRSGRDDRWDKERRERDRDHDHDHDPDRDESPEARRLRRSARHRRYDTEDTDYYSDRDREKRRYREGSYTSKPPRPEERSRRHEERGRRHDTLARSRRHDEERDGRRRERPSERRYRDIEPARLYAGLRRVVTFSGDAKTNCGRREEERSPARAESREPRDERRRERRHRAYYDQTYGAGYGDPYQLQRAQYQYYEHLRHTDPAAYMQVYKQLMAGQPPPPPPPDFAAKVAGFISLRDYQPEERGSVHSGRSSANDLKANDTLFAYRGGAGSLRGAGNASLRTDLSDRDLTTDASLNLQLEESTVRSERMTPFKYSTAHIKGSVGARHVVVVRPAYPVDGRPATVHVLSLAAAQQHLHRDLTAFPGPLLKGVTHKKSVIEYCLAKARAARAGGGAGSGAGGGAGGVSAQDPRGAALLWELLALLLRQNGVVVGTDLAELLMKAHREQEPPALASRRESSQSGSARGERGPPLWEPPADPATEEQVDESRTGAVACAEAGAGEGAGAGGAAALERLRELLLSGDRQEAVEWAMSRGLWGHALCLAASRRSRLQVRARFEAALAPRDPLRTLYCALQARLPPALPSVGAEGGGWEVHAAMVLANAEGEAAARALAALAGALAPRAPAAAQACLLAAGARPAPHPAQPLLDEPVAAAPRLALLLGDARASSPAQLAPLEAIFATEVYEYALSLHQDHVVEPLQTYKLVVATQLCDVGEYSRALAYAESAARGALRLPRAPRRLLRALAALADRLMYEEGGVGDEAPAEAGSGEASPERAPPAWLDHVRRLAHDPPPAHHADHAHHHQMEQQQSAAASLQSTPQHQMYDPQQYSWGEQGSSFAPVTSAPQHGAAEAPPAPAEEAPHYAAQYYQQPPPPPDHNPEPASEPPPYESAYEPAYEPAPEHAYTEPAPDYWQPAPYSYGEAAAAGAEEPRPLITMPGAPRDRPPSPDSERETDTPMPAGKSDKGKEEGKRGGWLGGILGKLSLRAPHQMILPDDRNPTIVWDEQSKRWRDTGGEAAPAPAPPPPPPAAPRPAPLRSSSPPLQPAGAPPPVALPPVANIFKMQKGRHIKNSYVDVLNPGGGAGRGAGSAPGAPLAPPAPPAAPPAFFVPQPLPHQGGALEPARAQGEAGAR